MKIKKENPTHRSRGPRRTHFKRASRAVITARNSAATPGERVWQVPGEVVSWFGFGNNNKNSHDAGLVGRLRICCDDYPSLGGGGVEGRGEGGFTHSACIPRSARFLYKNLAIGTYNDMRTSYNCYACVS